MRRYLYTRSITRPSMWQHPDTAAGARECLNSLVDAAVRQQFAAAVYKADPSVEGVWAADLPDGTRAIIYLCGYKTPFGSPREHNDFEVGQR